MTPGSWRRSDHCYTFFNDQICVLSVLLYWECECEKRHADCNVKWTATSP